MIKIRVLSFDFDGCLFNVDYVNPSFYLIRTIRNDVLRFNVKLFDEILKQNAGDEFDQIITMIGSNRQSWADDKRNADVASKGSCFPAIEAVTEHLGATFDPFLLADADNGRDPGTAFTLAMYALNHPEAPLTDCIPGEDEHLELERWYTNTKITLLYAQMHRQACEHPKDSISFDFYDDREDILNDISYYFRSMHVVFFNPFNASC